MTNNINQLEKRIREALVDVPTDEANEYPIECNIIQELFDAIYEELGELDEAITEAQNAR